MAYLRKRGRLGAFTRDIGRRKARVVAEWLETRGFETFIEERRSGTWTKRAQDEPAVAFCGVDNAATRAALDDAGFGLVLEAGLGSGPQAFRSFAFHTFPSSRRAEDIWFKQVGDPSADNLEALPAYRALKRAGIDDCGLAMLASRTVGVPFVGLFAACVAVAEPLRRLHGGTALEFVAGSSSDPLGDPAGQPRFATGGADLVDTKRTSVEGDDRGLWLVSNGDGWATSLGDRPELGDLDVEGCVATF